MALESRHPNPDELLAWTEGELDWRRRLLISRHVRSCWQCRARAREWEAAACEVAAGIDRMPLPTRAEITKAWWRFRQACVDADPPAAAPAWRLRPVWSMALATAVVAVAFAVVTTQRMMNRVEAPRPAAVPKAGPVRPPAPAPPPPRAAPVRRVMIAPLAATPAADLDPKLPAFSATELLSAEVRTLYELHRARLCGFEVRVTETAVEVHGAAVSADIATRLQALFGAPEFDGLVQLRLADAPSTGLGPETDFGAESPATKRTSPIEEWLRRRLGPNATQREIFNTMAQLVIEAEAVSEHAWALRRLAEQFSPSRTRELDPEWNGLLLRMASDHAAAVVGNSESLRRRFGVTHEYTLPASDPGGRNQSWQEGALALQKVAEAAAGGLLASVSNQKPTAAPVPAGVYFEQCVAAARGLRSQVQQQLAQAP